MTFLELWDDALDIELATSDTTQLFTAARRKKAINDGVLAFVRLTSCTRLVGSISIVDEQALYDLETEFTNYMRMWDEPAVRIVESGGTIRYIQGGDLQRRDVVQLDDEEPGWRTVSAGTPYAWYIEEDGGSTALGLHPAPDVGAGETWSIRLRYVYAPATMTADAHLPFSVTAGTAAPIRLIPYHQALVHYAAAQLEDARKNYSAYQRQMSLFNGWVAAYMQDQTDESTDEIRMDRDYYGESRSTRPLDPRRWP